MTRILHRPGTSWSLALTLAAGLAVMGGASYRASARGQAMMDLAIFRGDDAQTSGITPVSWGSGTVAADTKVVYSGSESLKIATQGLYQGASLTFTRPFDLGPYLTSTNSYLQFALKPPVSANDNTGIGPGRGPGFPGYPGPPGGGQTLSGSPEGGGPPTSGSPYGSGGYNGGYGNTNRTVKFQKAHDMENLRVLMVTAGGKSLEMLLPLLSASDDGQWKLLSIPVPAIPGLKPGDTQIKEIRLSGDTSGTFYLGKIGVVVDSTPITVDHIDDKLAPRNAVYRYTALAHGGATPIKVTWDWDASDGIQVEAEGRSVTHAFRRTGDFVVTVTASDLYGYKKPASTTYKIHITP